MNRNKGFTLIELLVVIAIIGILSSVVLASLNTARTKARDSRRISDIKSLQLALELYADDNSGDYPDALSDLTTNGYISKIPTDPGSLAQSGSNAYWYAVLDAEYHIAADLESDTSAPSNDADCNSAITTSCFPVALTGGFDGAAAPATGEGEVRYDQRS